MKSRILIVFFFLLLLGSIVVLRAAWLQFLPNEKLKTLKARQFQTIVTLPSRRGPILDYNGRDLALSTAAYSLYADPSIMKNKRQVAKKIAKHLSVSPDFIYKRIQDSKRRFTWIQRRIEPSRMEKIKAYRIRGLNFVEEWQRIYPNEKLMNQVIGFLGNEGQGLEGLELYYEKELKGNSQKVAVKRDARGRPLVSEGLLFKENPEGHELHLTVDSELQYQLENELNKTIQDFEAESAMGIILDAKTSAVRAIASVSLDSNQRRNRVVTDFFEPGSVIKPFVVAKWLSDGRLLPNSKYDCEMGSMKIGNRTIRESDSKQKHGKISVSEILAYSSNVGTSKIALEMGSNEVRQALSTFGFGERTGVDLPGEVRGIMHSLPWGDHQTATIAFGQGMTATALQVANAYAALAYDGKLRKPYIVDKIKNLETGEELKHEPEIIRQVMNAKQAESMRMMLTAVTQEGATGVPARVPGFQVAGKTGTAQKAKHNGRGYEPGAYIASFAGMIPAHKPEYVIYVIVDHPKKAYYASQVAAPLFSRIASFAVRKAGLSPSLLGQDDYRPNSFKKLETVSVEKRQRLISSTDFIQKINSTEQETVPDLMHLSLREAMKKLESKNIKIKALGQGHVKQTWPAYGDHLNSEETLTIYLE